MIVRSLLDAFLLFVNVSGILLPFVIISIALEFSPKETSSLTIDKLRLLAADLGTDLFYFRHGLFHFFFTTNAFILQTTTMLCSVWNFTVTLLITSVLESNVYLPKNIETCWRSNSTTCFPIINLNVTREFSRQLYIYSTCADMT